jgi:pheromone shutdown protein TraB
MLKSMSLSEKFKLLFSGFGGFFVSKKRVESELQKIEKDFDQIIDKIGKKFPTIKRVLIDERNMYMVQQLVSADKQYGKVIAVVGDGHIPGLSTLLNDQNIDFETIRLNELRSFDASKVDTTTASFSIEIQ